MKEKQGIRRRIWKLLQEQKVARFPGAEGRIPNFTGAEKCAGLLAGSPLWKNASVIKANPDSPQRAIRQKALEQGKILYMAAPRLRETKPFVELDAQQLQCTPREASSIKGAFRYGRPVSLREMRPIDLIVCGSVAVNPQGARIGKGGGYSDLEYGLLCEEKKIGAETPVVTSVHPLQILEEAIPMTEHDIPLNAIVTPDGIVEIAPSHKKPKGIYWRFLPEEKIEAIPVLKTRRKAGRPLG